MYRILPVLRAEELPPPLWHRWRASRLGTKADEWGRKGGEREKGREIGRRRELGSAVCSRLLGNAVLAPPTHGGDCDVTRGTSRLLPPLRVSGTALPSLATGWVLDQALQPGPAFLRRRSGLRRQHGNAFQPYKLGVGSSGSSRTGSSEPAGTLQGLSPQSLVHGSA